MAEQSRACWGCGKEPAEGVKFQRCMRCAEAKLPSSYFCGEACMLANWPRHKAWHMEQKQLTATVFTEGGVLVGKDRSIAELAARVAEQRGGESVQLQAHAASLMSNGDLSGAAKAWRKLIKLRPDLPDPYARLATTLQRSNLFSEACPLFLKAVELTEPDTELWGTLVARAFGALRVESCVEVPRPAWWNDDDLKAISARAVAVSPNDVNVCTMRAHVLINIEAVLSSTSFEPRSAEELKQAAVCYRRAADLTLSSECSVLYGSFADACNEEADCMLAEAEAEAAAARKAAEAEAKEAREVAEAKAAAASEELLAEEEKEKEQAAAKNKAGNSKGEKGTGKKGKGKRS